MKEGGCDRTGEFAAEVKKKFLAEAYTENVIEEIRVEVFRQNAKWGAGRHMPSHTEQYWGPYMPSSNEAKTLVEEATEYGELTWEDILFEELCEAHAEKDDVEALCTELIQSAAVIVQWVADLRGTLNQTVT